MKKEKKSLIRTLRKNLKTMISSFGIFWRGYQHGLRWSWKPHPRAHFQHPAAGGACVQEEERCNGQEVPDHVCLSLAGAQTKNTLIFLLEHSEPVAAGSSTEIHASSFVKWKNSLGTCRKRFLLDPREEKKNHRKEPGLASGFCWERRTQQTRQKGRPESKHHRTSPTDLLRRLQGLETAHP